MGAERGIGEGRPLQHARLPPPLLRACAAAAFCAPLICRLSPLARSSPRAEMVQGQGEGEGQQLCPLRPGAHLAGSFLAGLGGGGRPRGSGGSLPSLRPATPDPPATTNLRRNPQPTYDKLISEVPKYKMITPSILCDRLRVSSGGLVA